MTDIVIAIPSFRRPEGLKVLLSALARLETPVNVSVLVADNDAEHREAVELCAATSREGYRWPLECVAVAERGIAFVRNALVEHALARAGCDFIAMLDDDEWPEPQWLDELLRVQETTGADAIQGTIRRVFDHEPEAWVAESGSFPEVTAPTGPVDKLIGAGNLLVRTEILRGVPAPWFDTALGLSGGEDVDFFLRLKEHGARFAWAKDAVAYELIPASRTTLKWALNRAYNVGNYEMRIFMKHRPPLAARLREYARIAAALVLYPPMVVATWASRGRSVRFLRKVYRAAGKAAALRGRATSEYAVVHGR